MSDEHVVDGSVAAETTVVEGPPAVTAADVAEFVAVRELSLLERIKALPQKRLDDAKPFVIPGTDIEVRIAPATPTAAFAATLSLLQARGIEDDDKRINSIRASANGIIKACVVDPVLDDEAIAALNEYNSPAYMALMGYCKEISGLEPELETGAVEDFS